MIKRCRHRITIFFLLSLLSPLLLRCDSDTLYHIKREIISSSNDAEEHADGTMDLSSSDLEMCWEEDVQSVGLRFSDITIPQGAKIVSAWIQFETDEPNTTKTKLDIYVEDSVHPSLFYNTPFNITSRKRWSRKVLWRPEPWRIVDTRGARQRTPNLSPLVQHLVDKKEWRSGSSILFIIRGAGKRVAKAFTDNTKDALAATPALHITYTPDPDSREMSVAPEEQNTITEPSPYRHAIRISEIMTRNATVDYDPDYKGFSDWIELHNESNCSIDLSGFRISNDPKKPQKWSFPPSTTIAPDEYLLIWADKKRYGKKALHTSFSLDASGGMLLLSDPHSGAIDRLRYPKQKCDISYGRYGDKYGYMHPTPGKPNLPAHKKAKRAKKPKFAQSSGFYKAPVTVALHAKKGAEIFFTLDGSTPTPEARRYTKPFKLYETVVVRAIALQKGTFPSPITMHTYLIDENTTLPVVSIGIDRAWLHDRQIGIARNYNAHWIRAASIEYFKDKKRQFGANVGLKISGNNTRDYPQKSLAIFFKKRFGSKALHYPLFAQKPWLKTFKSFTLRNTGTYWGHSLFSECISHKIVMGNMDIDAQSCQPTVVFINGIYQGIHNIRERMNEAYLRTNHHLKGKIDLIEHDEFYDTIKSGNIDGWYDLIDRIRSADITDARIYREIAAEVDIDELINHAITESFFGNSSIQHNVKRWRLRKPGAKWRTLLFDLDRGFDAPTDKVMGYLLDQSSTNTLFERLMQNAEFRTHFLSRYFTHLNTTFRPGRIDRFITEARDRIAPEVARHFKKWPIDYDGEAVSEKTWKQDVDALYRFSHERGKIVRRKLRRTFDLKGDPTLRLSAENGLKFYVDGVDVSKGYNGGYFNGAKITVRAATEPGCSFERWSDGEQNATRAITLKGDLNLAASASCR